MTFWGFLLALGGCCVPWSWGEPPAATGVLKPFLSRPLRVDHEMGPPFDHGSTDRDRALMHNGRLVPGKSGHRAHDWPVPVGTEVFAAAEGTVLFAGDAGPVKCDGHPADRNVWVKVLHPKQSDGDEYVTLYYHLSRVAVAAGERVTAGQKLGDSGNTGCSASPHLHFAVVRVTNPQSHEGVAFDPYGWTAAEPDPLALRGKPSAWAWREGQAPPLVRRHALQQPDAPPLTPVRITGTDALDPIGGEWIELAARGNARGPQSLAGLTLRNLRGDVFRLPDRGLAPGESVRIWTNRKAPAPGELSWGLDHEAWDDGGDCAMLVDRSGLVTAAMGTGSPVCRERLGRRL